MSEEDSAVTELREALKQLSLLCCSKFRDVVGLEGTGRVRVRLPCDGYAVVFDADGGLQLERPDSLRPANEADECILWMVVEAAQEIVIMLHKPAYMALNRNALVIVQLGASKLQKDE